MPITLQGTTSLKAAIPAVVSNPYIFEDRGRWWVGVLYPLNYKTYGPFTTHALAQAKAKEFE